MCASDRCDVVGDTELCTVCLAPAEHDIDSLVLCDECTARYLLIDAEITKFVIDGYAKRGGRYVERFLSAN